ncbi:EAL domain-containing protein [Thiohalocapsa marina]|uniref:cyclic-guanylate-specific phosphodiesterase n=1 Tax=Thiohalocapsa marina TaxID=424902 RepID=A0A5M8FL37_9GAMM|nr:EAL domain-containing protein [Thiohalocapsa marina]KAA6184466.1 EAL domain-containing protein [Thiohalocapsa marina]
MPLLKLQFAIALAYALLAAAGMVLAIPPGYASPLFPAAGLALAVALQFGRTALPGIWLGSAGANLWHSWHVGILSPTTTVLAVVIGIGAMLQAWFGAWLVRRWQGARWQALEQEQDSALLLLLGGVLACVLSASVGTAALLAADLVHPAGLAFQWWNWYLGDTLGVLIFAPLSLCLINRHDPVWRERLRRMVVPVLLALGLAVAAFHGAARWEGQQQQDQLSADAEQIAKGISARLITHREVLASLQHFIGATPDFDYEQFRLFTQITLQDNPDIFALSFNDLVADAERLDYEARISALSPLGAFQITERDANGQLIRAQTRPEYLAVRYIVPLAGNRPAVGYDIHSDPVRRVAIERARATDAMAVTAPILLVQEQQQRVGLLELLPVAAASDDGQPAAKPHRGFAVAVVKVDQMIDIATRGRVPDNLRFELVDLQAPPERGLLYRSDAPVPGPSPVTSTPVDWSTDLRMGDRDWQLRVAVTEAYRQQHRPWLAWAIGLVGLLFAALLQVLLLGMTGHAAIIQRKNTQLLLAEKVFDNSGEAIVVTDTLGMVLCTNPAFSRITGYAPEEIAGRNLRLLQSGRHSRDFYRDLWRQLKRSGQWQGEIWNRRKSGELYPEWLTIATVRDEQGAPIHYVGTFSDISAAKQAQEQIQFLAYHDALTGLANRMLCMDRIDHALAHSRRHGGRIALLAMDLDRFKLINDSYGHEVGDRLLKAVAKRLQHMVRAEDTLSRLSGDEFLIVLFDTGDDHAVSTKCEAILANLSRPFDLGGRQLSISFSIGVAVYPGDGDDTATLLRNADTALYQAKKSGRNTRRLFDQQMNQEVVRYVETRDALKLALAHGELELHYQPQIALGARRKDDRLIGAEALLRWNHPERGLVMPDDFIGVAEESGLIVPIGAWVLRQACRQAVAWQAAGLPVDIIAVNFSAVQFRQGKIDAVVFDALEESGLAPECLDLEITESILLEDLQRVLAALQRFEARGIQLSIDDFGTGFSSLSYLRQFPVHRLKIDRSFVRDILKDPGDRALVQTIIQMARNLNLRSIAEGVEDPLVLEQLRALGCNEAQGYLFSRPAPPEAFTRWLAGLGGGKP